MDNSKQEIKTKTPIWPIVLESVGVLLLWMILIPAVFLGLDLGMGGIILYLLVPIVFIFGAIAMAIYFNRKCKINSFYDKLFFNFSVILLVSVGLLIFSGITRLFIGKSLIGFISKILYFLSFSNQVIFHNFYLIFLYGILFIIFGLLAYGIASLSEVKLEKRGAIILFCIIIFMLIAIADNGINHLVYNCTADDQCLINKAISKNDIRVCSYFYPEKFYGNGYGAEMDCIAKYVDQKKMKPAGCSVISDEGINSLQKYCIFKTEMNFNTQEVYDPNDAASCEMLSDPPGGSGAKSDCYNQLGRHTGSIDFCDKMTNDIPEFKTRCKNFVYLNLAVNQFSLDVCDNILATNSVDGIQIQLCKDRVNYYKEIFDSAVNSGNPENCKNLEETEGNRLWSEKFDFGVTYIWSESQKEECKSAILSK